MDFDYKKYSLEKLEEWIHDSLSCAEASPQEIYDTIKKVVQENYYTYKNHTERCYELLALLNGNGIGHISAYDDSSLYCKGSWNDFCDWENDGVKEDKVVKWQLPVETCGISGESYVNFPDDLLEAANLKEGDKVEWVDQGDGSYLLKKIITEEVTNNGTI